MFAFYEKPRIAEVYNLGGGKANSCSILEAFAMTAEMTGKKQKHSYVDENRSGDHIVYYSDLRKMKSHYPEWDITKSLSQTLHEIADAWRQRLADN
jgi:CDP-paratose 2-epimerase